MAIIETRGLVRVLAGKRVIDSIDLKVPDNCVYGFLGPNGSGKTTTIRVVLGLLRPSSGLVNVLGFRMPLDRLRAAWEIGALVETPALYDHLTGVENLEITRRMLGLPASAIGRALELVDLSYAARQRAGTYSLGMRQRLGLARALIGRPRLLVLDEPTNGLDPHGIIEVRNLIRELPVRDKVTVFVSSHMLNEIELVADYAGLLHQGRLLAQAPLRELLDELDTELEVAVARAKEAVALLQARGFRATATGDNTLTVSGLGGDAARAAEVNRALVEAGFAVSAISFRPVSLEDLFLRLTRETHAAA